MRGIYHHIHTQGGYVRGTPLYTHPGRLCERYTLLYTPREAMREVYTVIHTPREAR